MTHLRHCRIFAVVENTSSPDLVATAEAAEILTCSGRTVLRLVESGRLAPAVKIPGQTGAYLFHRSDVEALAGAAEAQDGAA